MSVRDAARERGIDCVEHESSSLQRLLELDVSRGATLWEVVVSRPKGS